MENDPEIALGSRLRKRLSHAYQRKADGEFETHLVALSCSESPAGHSQWSLQLRRIKMVELNYVSNVSHETVRQVKKTSSSY